MTLPKDHRCFDDAFRCAAEVLTSNGLTWLHLKAQAIQESALKPDAISPTGPRGIMQFTAATGREWGLLKDAEFFNPEKSIEAGARYMDHLLKLLRDGVEIQKRRIGPVPNTFERWQFALAAYNQGIGNLSKAVERAHRFEVDTADWACVAHEYSPIMLTAKRIQEVLNYVARIKKILTLLKIEHTPPAAAAARAA